MAICKILPKYWKSENYESFIRQLHTYGFFRTDTHSWQHPVFARGKPDDMVRIKRKKSTPKKEDTELDAEVMVFILTCAGCCAALSVF